LSAAIAAAVQPEQITQSADRRRPEARVRSLVGAVLGHLALLLADGLVDAADLLIGRMGDGVGVLFRAEPHPENAAKAL
jgi:hypothetical protein